ncbi:MAG: hypothetical protein HKM02_00850, partial [Pseudomonadales bacterium]|nr:hypothetical protein [Pseudomonadales bacterium]
RVVVLRAGSQAASLKVISDFFDDLASKTISMASTINVTALEISRLAVMSWRSDQFYRRLRTTLILNPLAAKDPLLNTLLYGERRDRILQDRYRKGLQQLSSELEDIQQFMRAANVISVTSRLEATQTGTFQGTLVSMANTIQKQSDAIKSHVVRSQRMIQDLH